jgi:Pentapeptide repeats (8 copies)
MSMISRWLRTSRDTDDKIHEAAERLYSASEFVEHAAEALEEGEADSLVEAVSRVLPWIDTAVSDFWIVGEAIPVVKVVLSVAKAITRETDPEILGLLAFSLAYQSATAQALKDLAKDPDLPLHLSATMRPGLRRKAAEAASDAASFAGFRLANSFEHELVRAADQRLMTLAQALGWPEPLRNQLLERIHARFRQEFARLISDGRTQDKFAPLRAFLGLSASYSQEFAAVDRHIAYQLWCFSQAPVLGAPEASILSRKSPRPRSSLKDIYIPPDCGALVWEQISNMKTGGAGSANRTPFSEQEGGRKPLLEEVLKLIAEKSFHDAIVIQGIAGSGKSAFTLYLCTELRALGLRPVRIRMRHLPIGSNMTLGEEFAEALSQNSGDQEFDSLMGPRPRREHFSFTHLFAESVSFRGTQICPHVLILDGWDEVSVSVSEGFRRQIEDLLRGIRGEIIGRPGPPVRVILTGRPSLDVEESHFLRAGTPVLTIRPLVFEQFETLSNNVIAERAADDARYRELKLKVGALYRRVSTERTNLDRDGLGILGLPLLALLAVWLTLTDEAQSEEVGNDLTALYRRLIDMTCKHGGSVEIVDGAKRFVGRELRIRLRSAAAAITAQGGEHISFAQLEHRMTQDGLDAQKEADRAADRAMRESPVVGLILSFFLVANTREQGCEFVHKSFREYLFAEAIVETLKAAAEDGTGETGEESSRRLPPRMQFWADFSEPDPRAALVERIGTLMCPQWLGPEVVRHLSALVEWEIERSAASGAIADIQTHEMQPVPLGSWRVVRDRMADLWDWWADGAHLREQPYMNRILGRFDLAPSRAVGFVTSLVPVDLPKTALPKPIRNTTVDAHLGDALFRLNCILHFQIKQRTGWLPEDAGRDRCAGNGAELWANTNWEPSRRYQSRTERGGKVWYSFTPSSPDGKIQYMLWLASRIDAAGWRPDGPFPCGIDMRGINLRGSGLEHLQFVHSTLSYANLSNTRLCGADFCGAESGALMPFGFLREGQTDLFYANLSAADLHHANLSGVQTSRAALTGANLSNADLSDADLTGSILRDTNLSRTDLSRANLSNSDLRGARNLRQGQVNEACSTQPPQLPEGIEPPPIACTV